MFLSEIFSVKKNSLDVHERFLTNYALENQQYLSKHIKLWDHMNDVNTIKLSTRWEFFESTDVHSVSQQTDIEWFLQSLHRTNNSDDLTLLLIDVCAHNLRTTQSAKHYYLHRTLDLNTLDGVLTLANGLAGEALDIYSFVYDVNEWFMVVTFFDRLYRLYVKSDIADFVPTYMYVPILNNDFHILSRNQLQHCDNLLVCDVIPVYVLTDNSIPYSKIVCYQRLSTDVSCPCFVTIAGDLEHSIDLPNNTSDRLLLITCNLAFYGGWLELNVKREENKQRQWKNLFDVMLHIQGATNEFTDRLWSMVLDENEDVSVIFQSIPLSFARIDYSTASVTYTRVSMTHLFDDVDHEIHIRDIEICFDNNLYFMGFVNNQQLQQKSSTPYSAFMFSNLVLFLNDIHRCNASRYKCIYALMLNTNTQNLTRILELLPYKHIGCEIISGVKKPIHIIRKTDHDTVDKRKILNLFVTYIRP